jgi:hypothetical protein
VRKDLGFAAERYLALAFQYGSISNLADFLLEAAECMNVVLGECGIGPLDSADVQDVANRYIPPEDDEEEQED